MATVGGVVPASPNKGMSEKAKTQIIVAVISGVVSIVVAIIGTLVALKSSGSQITNLNEQAQNIKQSIDYIATPPGTIAAYGGPLDQPALEKQGWLPCDGREVSRKTYNLLFEKVGSCWGSGDGVNTFNLPDLRGVFLRGVNGVRKDQFSDSDANDRVNLADGGNTKNKVGTYQPDSLVKHAHFLFKDYESRGGGKVTGTNAAVNVGFERQSSDYIIQETTGEPDSGMTSFSGGSETRPKNAYVYYIIKF